MKSGIDKQSDLSEDKRKGIIFTYFLGATWVVGTIIVETVVIVMAVFAASYFWKDLQSGTIDHASVIVQAAKKMIPLPIGILLLGAATAVVISTGMNYLLSPTTTLIHDIYKRFIKKSTVQGEVSERKMI